MENILAKYNISLPLEATPFDVAYIFNKKYALHLGGGAKSELDIINLTVDYFKDSAWYPEKIFTD